MPDTETTGYTHTTKYKHGDHVYNLETRQEKKRITCKVCKGNGSIRFPEASRDSICPENQCRHGQVTTDTDTITYTITPLTIGKVEISAKYTKPEDDDGLFDNVLDPENLGPIHTQIKYMCIETGIGGGRIYNEQNLYPSYNDALAAAKEQGAIPRPPEPTV